VHLERKPHTALGEHVEDRIPPLGELSEAGVEPSVGSKGDSYDCELNRAAA
jgi:hypothetical protein